MRPKSGIVGAVACASLALAASASASFPGANGKIAFVSFDGTNPEIVTMDPNGANQAFITDTGSGIVNGAPTWSADGERLAFHSNRNGDYDIFVADPAGQNLVQLTSGPNSQLQPSFSPDGAKIAYRGFDGSDNEIFVMNADGSGQTPLTANSSGDGSPAFSPDGNTIAYVSNAGGDEEIYVMNADGSGQRPLTENTVNDAAPSWSPDGHTILFTRPIAGFEGIFTMDADGQGQAPLASSPATGYFNPVFSPDNLQIAFNTGSDEIFVMNRDGQNQQNVTNSPMDDGEPDWQPLNPPAIDVTAGTQKSPKHVTVTVVSQNEDATATLGGTLKAPKPKAAASKAKQVTLEPLTLALQPGVPVTVDIAVAGKGSKLLKKALKAGKKPNGTITASATDSLGGSATDTADVKYKKKKKK